jgi:alpha-amylase/alpha-mannosidase (GH57 family)
MSDASVDLVLIWHHHQPDYRRPSDRRAMLPWVRLHAAKDYLDMAVHIERQPGVRVTFNLVPSLVDQLDDAVRGEPDLLFDLLRRPVDDLSPDERGVVVDRCRFVPPHALERWPRLRRLVSRAFDVASFTAYELLELEVWFLLAWIDPMFLGEPEAVAAVDRAQAGGSRDQDRSGLLGLHERLTAAVLPAYRRLAEAGQIELSTTPYYHPILPLLVDVRSARRARPEMPLPEEPFAAPEDALAQIRRAVARHTEVFGAPPAGMWPSEGSVSPEAAELIARSGLRWVATDEGVLWNSLPVAERRREQLYRPWVVPTGSGELSMFFRDHELSDRIGFVYQRWNPHDAANDFVERLRRIGREHGSAGTPVVSVILDGENCWEGYAEDGRAFLEALYAALATAPDVRTRTPSDVLAGQGPRGRLERLHSGSWIDADFHIWIGHPEKNLAWDHVARARRAIVEAGATPESCPAAWESLRRAEGSDWFWWFGEDHYTADKALFDELFRNHLRDAYQAAGRMPPAALQVPVSRPRSRQETHERPIGFVRPVVDGEATQFYEWHAAGRCRLDAGGGSMHRAEGLVRELRYGFDLERLYVRLDFVASESPGEGRDLMVELMRPHPATILVRGLARGDRAVAIGRAGEEPRPAPEARCRIGAVLELSVRFADLGLASGEEVDMLVQLLQGGRPTESHPADEPIRFTVPDASFESGMWSA